MSRSNGRCAVGWKSSSSEVSSRASRIAAASSEMSVGSTWPPGWSSRPRVACATRHMRSPVSSTTKADAVKWARAWVRDVGFSSSSASRSIAQRSASSRLSPAT